MREIEERKFELDTLRERIFHQDEIIKLQRKKQMEMIEIAKTTQSPAAIMILERMMQGIIEENKK